MAVEERFLGYCCGPRITTLLTLCRAFRFIFPVSSNFKEKNTSKDFHLTELFKYDRTEMLSVEPKRNSPRRVGMDARKCREWPGSRIRKANVSEVMLGKREKLSQGGGCAARANASKEFEEGVAEISHSKRQRVDLDSKQQCVCNTEPSHDLHNLLVVDVWYGLAIGLEPLEWRSVAGDSLEALVQEKE
nr:hypothetical protein CFP56_14965 [Quercus suber]